MYHHHILQHRLNQRNVSKNTLKLLQNSKSPVLTLKMNPKSRQSAQKRLLQKSWTNLSSSNSCTTCLPSIRSSVSALDCLTMDLFTMNHLMVIQCAQETLHFKFYSGFFCKTFILKRFLWAHVKMQSNKPPRSTLTTSTKLIFAQTTTPITIATKNEILLTYHHHLPNMYNLETAVLLSQISPPLPNRPQIRLICLESTVAV